MTLKELIEELQKLELDNPDNKNKKVIFYSDSEMQSFYVQRAFSGPTKIILE